MAGGGSNNYLPCNILIQLNNNSYNKNLRPFARQLRNNGTKAEACLWKYVLRAGNMKGYDFKRQRPVLNYIADFCCEELKLVIEVDGITHYNEEGAMRDKQKDEALKQAGYSVLRFTDDDVLKNIGGVAHVIEDWIDKVLPR